MRAKGLFKVLGAMVAVAVVIGVALPFSAEAMTAAAGMQSFDVQLQGGKPGWEVYELIILGEGGNGKDHWGWRGGTGVYSADGNRQLKRDEPDSWLPISGNNTLKFAIPSARSRDVAGVARIIKRKAPGSNEGIHGTAAFFVNWPQ